MVHIIRRRVCLTSHVFIVIPQSRFDERLDEGSVQPPKPARQVTEAQQGIPPHHGIGMAREFTAHALRPFPINPVEGG
jgi:hypothetical protein